MFPGTLSDDAQDALAVLGKSGILNWAYLAGGSALALYLGHRRSVDFDLFSAKPFSASLLERVKRAVAPHEITVTYRTEGQLRDILVQGCHPRESGDPAESKANSAGFPLSRE